MRYPSTITTHPHPADAPPHPSVQRLTQPRAFPLRNRGTEIVLMAKTVTPSAKWTPSLPIATWARTQAARPIIIATLPTDSTAAGAGEDVWGS
jgi:hypothetical protein